MPLKPEGSIALATRKETITMSVRKIKAEVCLLAVGYVLFQLLAASAQDTSRGSPPASQKEIQEGVSIPSVYLRKVGEPPVLTSPDDLEALSYRFIWISVYPQSKIIVLRIKIEKDGAAKLFVKVTSIDGETILLTKEDIVSVAAVNRFLEVVNRSDFWRLTTREQPEPSQLDGTTWYLEGVRHGTYHMVYRLTPELNPGPFTDIGRNLAKDLAHLDDSTIHIPRGDQSKPLRRDGHQ